MEKLETYYIGLDETEAEWMDDIVEMNRAITLMVKIRDQKVKDFMEVFGPKEIPA